MSEFGCCHGGDHAASPEVPVLRSIDFDAVRCLNEAVEGSSRALLRAHCSSADKAAFCDSDGSDPELLLHIPFTSTVRLRGLCISAAEGACPASVSLFVNSPGMTFSDLEGRAPAQEVALAGADPSGTVFYPLRAARFNTVLSLQLAFRGVLGAPPGEGEGPVRLFFVGLLGEATGFKKGVVECTYEVRPSAVDSGGMLGGGASSLPGK